MDVVADVAGQCFLPRGAGHPQQGRVGLDHAAGHVGDADADGRVGEHRAELRLAGPQRRFGLVAGVQHRAADGLLLAERAFPQCLRVAGGQRSLQARDPVGEAVVVHEAELVQ
jgi:hypothetical protein